MVRVWHLSMSMPAVQFRTSLGQGFSEKYHASPLLILDIVSMLCPWARHFII